MVRRSNSSQCCGDSRVVKTIYGQVVGRRFVFGNKEVDAFQGIPFASPPVGNLRFKKPVPPEPWEGVKVTKAFAARGIQKDGFFFEKLKLGKTSEDNLYLNVFTPAWSPSTTSGFAVMVFIHGGGFVGDSAVKYGDVGICEHLCTKDVVVVTAQYRIGLLGFFSTGDEHCRGNFGLWDQTLALKWVKLPYSTMWCAQAPRVINSGETESAISFSGGRLISSETDYKQENIASFNGDPDNVTVMGQSAGGASVDLLSICPHSRDLFHRVLPMGGNASCVWGTHSNMVEVCRKFAERNGVVDTLDSEKMIETLRRLPAHKYALSMTDNLRKSDNLGLLCPVGPRIDDDFIPKSVSQLRKEAPGKPMMTGCCASEGLLLGKDATVSSIMDCLAQLVPEEKYPFAFKRLRLEIFRKLLSDPHDSAEVKRGFVELLGDFFTNIGIQMAVCESLEAHSAPVYFYSFDYFNPKSWGPLSLRWPFKDATHCTELAYIFAVGIVWNFAFNDDDKRMLEITTRMWTNFAKYGDPNGDSSDPSSSLALLCETPFTWEPATISNPQKHLSISLQPEMKDEYKKGRPLLIVQMQKRKDELREL